MKNNARIQIDEDLKIITLDVLNGKDWIEIQLPYEDNIIELAKLADNKHK